MNISEGKKVILCFDFIRKNRGYEYLLDATKDMEGIVVIVAEKIDDQDTYKQIMKFETEVPNLRVFAKWIADDELRVYFNACDIVVLPYANITPLGVIPLAYAFSKPIIAPCIGGIKDVVNSKQES